MKAFAATFKVMAALIWVFVAYAKPPCDAPLDGATAAYYIQMYSEMFMFLVVALLAVVPNRWLVFSRVVFALSLIIAILPFCVLMVINWNSDPFGSNWDFLEPGNLIFLVSIFGPLPLAITLSFLRRRRGEDVGYV